MQFHVLLRIKPWESNILSVQSSFSGLWAHCSALLMTQSSEGGNPPQTLPHPFTPKKKVRGQEFNKIAHKKLETPQ